MRRQLNFFGLLAVISISITSAFASESTNHNLTARAMLMKMPAEQFRQISTNDSETFQMPAAMEVIGCLFSETDTTLAAYSELQINTEVKNAASENKIADKVMMPLRETVTGKDIEPYTKFIYKWLENRKYFKVRMHEKTGNNAFRCECVFEYKNYQVIAVQNKSQTQNNSDEITEIDFSSSTEILLNVGEVSVAGCQKIGEDYYILLVNLQ
ncbi:MAG: hypothetical protein ACIAQZ_12915 [Sedimentisphaeraceae bacterium JB056]